MELCDQTLEEKIKMQEGFDKSKACIEFCSGLDIWWWLNLNFTTLFVAKSSNT